MREPTPNRARLIEDRVRLLIGACRFDYELAHAIKQLKSELNERRWRRASSRYANRRGAK